MINLMVQDKAFNPQRNGTRDQVIGALNDAKAAGLSVVRTWFFQDDPTAPTLLQPRPGNSDV